MNYVPMTDSISSCRPPRQLAAAADGFPFLVGRVNDNAGALRDNLSFLTGREPISRVTDEE
jgi:hypothetical protein